MGDILNIKLFGDEIGRLGYDNDKRCSYFQYSPDYLAKNNNKILPFIIKRPPEPQTFPHFEG